VDERDPAEAAWEAWSFFSASADEQIPLIGPAEEWFTRENAATNPGANYLRGLASIALTFDNAFLDSTDIVDVGTFEALRKALWDLPSRAWNREALRADPEWAVVRDLAARLLAEAGLPPNLPTKPFWIPDFMEVEAFQIDDPAGDT
jgi:hypothetical protein